MNYWLFKSEPSTFSLDDLENKPSQTSGWDGVRNYQARNFLRDSIQKGDLAFFYHSSCPCPGIVGIMEVVRAGYPDLSSIGEACDPDPEKPRWYQVDIQFKQRFKRVISLSELKNHPLLKDMRVAKRGNRLSITPVTETEWKAVLALSLL